MRIPKKVPPAKAAANKRNAGFGKLPYGDELKNFLNAIELVQSVRQKGGDRPDAEMHAATEASLAAPLRQSLCNPMIRSKAARCQHSYDFSHKLRPPKCSTLQ